MSRKRAFKRIETAASGSLPGVGLRLVLGLLLSLAIAWLVGLTWTASNALPATAADSASAGQEQASPAYGRPSGSRGGFPDLVSGLRATPGCLGVESARTESGKLVIFAWFKDKKAAIDWYRSDMHRKAQDRYFPNRPKHEPLEHVPDDIGPIMAIASLTMTDSAHAAVRSLPVSQIAIELYHPLPGGVFLGSRFAPMSVAVPHMLDYTPKASDSR